MLSMFTPLSIHGESFASDKFEADTTPGVVVNPMAAVS